MEIHKKIHLVPKQQKSLPHPAARSLTLVLIPLAGCYLSLRKSLKVKLEFEQPRSSASALPVACLPKATFK